MHFMSLATRLLTPTGSASTFWRGVDIANDLHSAGECRSGRSMSDGRNVPDLFRRAAEYVDKILRGAKPADLPVEQAGQIDPVVNLVTAKVLGLEVPPTLLARADEVIE